MRAGQTAKASCGAVLVYDAHEFHEDEDPAAPARGAWVKRTELKAATHLDSFVTINRSIAELYAAERPDFPPARIVHNAVDTQKRAPGAAHWLSEKIGAAAEHKILLYHGAFAPMRGLETLIRTASLLNKDWTLVLMGQGRLEPALRALADPARVHFLPPVPNSDLQNWISGATLGAALYEDTGRNQHFCSPNKLWEYPAAEVALLASDLPEIRRIAGALGAAFLVPAGAAPDEIAHRINSLSPNDLETARQAARTLSAAQSWSSEVAPLLADLHALAEKAKPR
jgi:glycosyltransferase involved in cell wall biosynthesis